VADTWYHIAFVFDGTFTDGDLATQNAGRMQIYLNGVSETLTFTGTIPATTSDFSGDPSAEWRIGGDGYADNFDGNISNVALFDSALSAANVLAIYNNGRPGDLTSLSPVSWWKLGNEAFCPDYTASPNVWEIPDQMPAGNDGTSAGNPDLVGEAPQSFANGLSVSMDIDDRIGESGFSDNNALSYNMDFETRTTETAP